MIVCGIVDNTVRDRLLCTDELTLPRAIQVSKQESLYIDGGIEKVQGIALSGRGLVYGLRGGGERARGAMLAGARASTAGCERCGSARCARGDRLPACDILLCFICDRKGRFARTCERKNIIREALNLSVVSTESDDEKWFYVDTITEEKNLVSPLPSGRKKLNIIIKI